MRFLMIASGYPPARSAGLERGCQRLSAALVRRGHAVIVLTLASTDLAPDAVEPDGVRVLRALKPLALGPLWGLDLMRQVRSWAMRLAGEWDFALCHKLYLHSAALAAAGRRIGKPTGSLLVNAGPFSDIKLLREHRFGEWLLRESLRDQHIFALSADSVAELASEGVSDATVRRYRYFVDLARFTPAPAASPPEFLYIGRFHPQKNIPGLIDAFEILHRIHPQARLRLVGDGPTADALLARIAASPARDAIKREAWTAAPEVALQKALAVVTATHAEGLSNVLVETIACGTPAITTDVSGARDVLFPESAPPRPLAPGAYARGRGGLLVPCADPAALAAAMGAVLTDGTLRFALASEARARASLHYSEESCVGDFLTSVNEILTGRARP